MKKKCKYCGNKGLLVIKWDAVYLPEIISYNQNTDSNFYHNNKQPQGKILLIPSHTDIIECPCGVKTKGKTSNEEYYLKGIVVKGNK